MKKKKIFFLKKEKKGETFITWLLIIGKNGDKQSLELILNHSQKFKFELSKDDLFGLLG